MEAYVVFSCGSAIKDLENLNYNRYEMAFSLSNYRKVVIITFSDVELKYTIKHHTENFTEISVNHSHRESDISEITKIINFLTEDLNKICIYYGPEMNFIANQIFPIKSIYYSSDFYFVPDNFDGGVHGLAKSLKSLYLHTRTAIKSDMVISVSPPLRLFWSIFNRKSLFIPNGHHYNNDLNEIQHILNEPSNFIVFGRVNWRIDCDLINSIARDYSVSVVGIVDNNERCKLSNNVNIIAPIPKQDLYKFVNNRSIGLIPYNRSVFNYFSFPLKVFDYLNLGLPVFYSNINAKTMGSIGTTRVSSKLTSLTQMKIEAVDIAKFRWDSVAKKFLNAVDTEFGL